MHSAVSLYLTGCTHPLDIWVVTKSTAAHAPVAAAAAAAVPCSGTALRCDTTKYRVMTYLAAFRLQELTFDTFRCAWNGVAWGRVRWGGTTC